MKNNIINIRILKEKIINKFFSFSLVMRGAIISIFICLLLLLINNYFLYCNNAFVESNLIKITPKIDGYLTNIYIEDNHNVKKGDKLIEIDPTPYQLKINLTDAKIKQAQNSLQASIQAKETAIDNRNNIKDQLDFAQDTLKRYRALENNNFVSKQKIDELTTKKKTLEASLEQAESEITEAAINITKEQLNIKIMEEELASDRYNLSLTILHSPVDGVINNMELSEGDYASNGKELFGIIDNNKWRIKANYKQSDLDNIYKDKKVLIYLPNFPWKIWTGKVTTILHAVSRTASESNAALPYIEPVTDWIKYPYRFAVTIEFDELPPKEQLYMGMDAYTLILP